MRRNPSPLADMQTPHVHEGNMGDKANEHEHEPEIPHGLNTLRKTVKQGLKHTQKGGVYREWKTPPSSVAARCDARVPTRAPLPLALRVQVGWTASPWATLPFPLQ